jgi:hypothetical protein
MFSNYGTVAHSETLLEVHQVHDIFYVPDSQKELQFDKSSYTYIREDIQK